METYRDQYVTLFNNGRNVVVMGISVDADTTLASWFRELETPLMAVSDTSATISRAYQAYNEERRIDGRHLYVIDRTGKVAFKTNRFREMVQEAYDELAAVIDRLEPPKQEGSH